MPDGALSTFAASEMALSRRYTARPDVYDEMVDGSGAVRPPWRPFVGLLDGLGPAELQRRWEQAQELIHDNGVSFNVYGDAQGMERPWRLSPIPVVMGPADFEALAAGLTQRASLLDLLLADLYGPRRALMEGWLPPELVLSHPGFLRACHGIVPPRGRWLHLYAADLGRAPDGAWRVLSDRPQAPSGAGYALENRLVVSRVFPDVFRDCNVQRLALFFRTMRETLAALAPHNRDNPRVVLLSPGPYNATYFEQAFLAQYLGYQLADGADLTVRDGRVFLKTLGGLHAVDVILRRLNDDYCDPLELRPDSTLGVPGLVEALRGGGVAIANALGTGILQTTGVLPYLPRLCRGFLGEDLRLDGVDTWWCGEPSSLSHVVANIERLVIRPTFPSGFTQPIFGERLSRGEREELLRRIQAAPARYVAQERLAFSTTPLIEGEELRPRQLVLRSFLVARDNGYEVMPGGLSLVAGRPEELEISVQRGAGSKDTWVVTGGPVSSFSLLPPHTQPVEISRGGGDLPSRVADNLFWLGRYAERADAVARLGRTLALRLSDSGDPRATEQPELRVLLGTLAAITHAADLAPLPGGATRAPDRLVLDLLFAGEHHGSLRGVVRTMHRVAGVIRDRISLDTWRILNTLDQEVREEVGWSGRYALGAVPRLLDRLLMILAALSGLAMEGMTRGQGWRFLDMGRRLERAFNLAMLLNKALGAAGEREGPVLEALLEVADSSITYRRRYLASLQTAPVLDLLLTDETNPRSVTFQIAALSDHLPQLPHDSGRARRSPEERLILGALSRLRLLDVDAACVPDAQGRRPTLAQLLELLERDLPALSDALSGSYLNHATVSRQLVKANDGEGSG